MKRIILAILLALGFSAVASANVIETTMREAPTKLEEPQGAIPRAGLLAQISGHGTTLTWGASPSAATCVSPCTLTYNVFRGTVAGGESSAPQNATPITSPLTFFDAVTLTNSSQTFFYTVEAVETSGGFVLNSAPSNEVSVTFPALPGAPVSLSATPK